ncbi:phosphoribosylglycinamide formyltransferase [bacterium]|nr:phosphoribosylglycinamide formyltransferase [bacterium]
MRLAFFASGNGSTFQYLVEVIRNESLPADPALLICSRQKVLAAERARELNVPVEVISRKSYATIDEHSAALSAALERHRCDYILLAGYLELVPPRIVAKFRNRIVNIHPALLPAFGGKGMYGRRVHEAVIDYGARISGATVHFVDEEYDHGPILAQQAVVVLPNDTPDSLAERVQIVEKNLYAGALRLLVSKRLVVTGRKVKIIP